VSVGPQAPPSQPSPDVPVTKSVASRKLVSIIAGVVVVIILSAIGVYYVAIRSLPTNVSWAPSASAIAPGGDLTVSGKVTPAESGRHVSFESAPKTQGPWQPMPQAATTDINGLFTVSFTPQLTESIVMRAVVDPAGRYLAVTGASKPIRLLTLSSITLTGGGTIPTQAPLKFGLLVNPPSAARTVRIEQSSDKVRWVTVGSTARTKADGTSALSVPNPGVGVWSYRATVIQDEEFAAATSPVVGVTVEDIQAAAAAYLRIINENNAALDVYNVSAGTANNSPSVPQYFRSAGEKFSAANTKTAVELRAYGAWPESVKPLIDQIIAQLVIIADNMHQLSVVSDWSSVNTLAAQFTASNNESGRLSVLIRQALGLPQRPGN
jgi:hypothetical protein